jgi:hypothetical protein
MVLIIATTSQHMHSAAYHLSLELESTLVHGKDDNVCLQRGACMVDVFPT